MVNIILTILVSSRSPTNCQNITMFYVYYMHPDYKNMYFVGFVGTLSNRLFGEDLPGISLRNSFDKVLAYIL